MSLFRRAAGWLSRHRLSALIALGVVIASGGVATALLFVWPSTDPVQHADAVVLFAGGRGERLALAKQLMADGAADVLVIPNGTTPEWPQGNHECEGVHTYQVHCPTPDPDTTRGEARAIARLAHDQGWKRIIVVTSSYQLSRASLLLSRCYPGEILTTRADPHLGALELGGRIAHEWLAWTRAVVLQRAC